MTTIPARKRAGFSRTRKNTMQEKLLKIVSEFKAFMAESAGVAGFHLNGDVILWDEVLSGPLGTLGKFINNPPILAEFTFDYEHRINEDDDCQIDDGVIRYYENGVCQLLSAHGEHSRELIYTPKNDIITDIYDMMAGFTCDIVDVKHVTQSI